MDKNEALVLLAILVVGAVSIFSLLQHAGITGMPVIVEQIGSDPVLYPTAPSPTVIFSPSMTLELCTRNAQLQVGPNAVGQDVQLSISPELQNMYTGLKAACSTTPPSVLYTLPAVLQKFCVAVVTAPSSPTISDVNALCPQWSTLPGDITGPVSSPTVTQLQTQRFVRGDANTDGKVDLSDAVQILSYQFLGGQWKPGTCGDECKKVVGTCETSALRKFSSCLVNGMSQSEKCIKACASGPTLGSCIDKCDAAFDQNMKSCADKSGFGDCVAKQQTCLAAC